MFGMMSLMIFSLALEVSADSVVALANGSSSAALCQRYGPDWLSDCPPRPQGPRSGVTAGDQVVPQVAVCRINLSASWQGSQLRHHT